jgi:curved DNA-binding protein CbpA
MSFQGDPHRALGVAPGASLNEIKSAYRRLVKQYHPDAAGERALPRFLAIQAAYERLVDGEGRLRAPAQPGSPRRQEPWRADATRARASRDAWRARRSGTGGTAGSTGGGGARAGGGRTGAPGDAGEQPKRERTHREHHAKRDPRTARPGSTTYDEAKEAPLDPEWEGGSWYGPSSGTYWTINPREYADPRKHGPEYQARARRASREAGESTGDAVGDIGVDDTDRPIGDTTGPESTPSGEAHWAWSTDPHAEAGPGGSTTTGGTEWGTRSWRYDDGPLDDAFGARSRPSGARSGRASADRDDVALPDLESLGRRAAPRNLLALARRDWRWRLALATVGWPPIGYAVATLLNELTGCAAFSAACPEPVPLASMAIQPLVVVALFLVPPAAAVAAFASIVGLSVALPVAAVLSIGSGPDARVGGPILGVLVAAGYLVGLAWGANAVWRTPDDDGMRGGAGLGT